jgi:hypothetical protein
VPDVAFAELPVDVLLLVVAFAEVPPEVSPDEVLFDAPGWLAMTLPLVVALDISFAPDVMAPVLLPIAFELMLPDVMFDQELADVALRPVVALLAEPPTVAEAPPVLMLPADVELLLGLPVMVWPCVLVPVELLLPPDGVPKLWLEPALVLPPADAPGELLLLDEVEVLLLAPLVVPELLPDVELLPVLLLLPAKPPVVALLLPELAPDNGVAVEPVVALRLLELPPEGGSPVELLLVALPPEVSFDGPPVTEPPVLLDGT